MGRVSPSNGETRWCKPTPDPTREDMLPSSARNPRSPACKPLADILPQRVHLSKGCVKRVKRRKRLRTDLLCSASGSFGVLSQHLFHGSSSWASLYGGESFPNTRHRIKCPAATRMDVARETDFSPSVAREQPKSHASCWMSRVGNSDAQTFSRTSFICYAFVLLDCFCG